MDFGGRSFLNFARTTPTLPCARATCERRLRIGMHQSEHVTRAGGTWLRRTPAAAMHSRHNSPVLVCMPVAFDFQARALMVEIHIARDRI